MKRPAITSPALVALALRARRRATLLPILVAVGALVFVGCVPAGDGVLPPSDRFYFPVALAVAPSPDGGGSLYVVNSDFDLQFNQGTVQSLDLERLHEVARTPCDADSDCADGQLCDDVPNERNQDEPSYFCVDASGEHAGLPCGPFRENTASERAVAPGRCGPVDLTEPEDGGRSLLRDSVATSAFATDVLLLDRPAEAAGAPHRLFIPVRGDSSLHYVDADDEGQLECGQSEERGSCSDDYRVSDGESRDIDEETLDVPVEPYGVAADPSGRVLVVAHQSGGKASAYLNDWVSEPRLVHVEEDLPTNPIGVASIGSPRPVAALGDDYQAGFLVTFRNDASVHLLRFFDDRALGDGGAGGEDEEARPFLFDVGRSLITVNTSGVDSRGIVVDDGNRRAAEEACAGDADCLEVASRTPLDVYVANRSPNSLLVGQSDRVSSDTAASDLPTFHDNVPLTVGPSRVVLGRITNADGVVEKRIFVVCFDSAIIYVYDPMRRRIETEIATGRGPHSIAFDPERALAYVGHFTDSYVGIVSLDQRFPRAYASMLATLGVPTSPRASK